MKRIWLILALLLAAPIAHAQFGVFQNNCEVGGIAAQVSGISSTNKFQGSWPGCKVTVYKTGTTTLATIYSDAGITPLTNPFTASTTNGSFIFYTQNAVDVTVGPNLPAVPATASMPSFTFVDPALGGGSGGANATILVPCIADNGLTDNAPIFNAAVAASVAVATAGLGQTAPALTFPTNGNKCGFGSTIRVPSYIQFQCGSPSQVHLMKNPALGANALIEVYFSFAPGGGYVHGGSDGCAWSGSGSATTGPMIELGSNSTDFHITNNTFAEDGGWAINDYNTERPVIQNNTFQSVFAAINTSGSPNNMNISGNKFMFTGGTDAVTVGSTTYPMYCYDINCVNGVYPAAFSGPGGTPAPLVPDLIHAAVKLRNADVASLTSPGQFSGSGGRQIGPGGIPKVICESCTVSQVNGAYTEQGGADFILGGQLFASHTTAVFGATASSVSIQEPIRDQPTQINQCSDANSSTNFAQEWIGPPDYCGPSLTTAGGATCNPSDPSSIGGGITKGTHEVVGVAAFCYQNGTPTFMSGTVASGANRGLQGTTATTWPVGAIIEDLIPNDDPSLSVDLSHIQSVNGPTLNGPGWTYVVDESNCKPISDFVLGFCDGGLQVQPTSGIVSANLNIRIPEMFNDGTVPFNKFPGLGRITCLSNCNINISGVNTGIVRPSMLSNATIQGYLGGLFQFGASIIDWPTFLTSAGTVTPGVTWRITDLGVSCNNISGFCTEETAPTDPVTGNMNHGTEYTGAQGFYGHSYVPPTVDGSGNPLLSVTQGGAMIPAQTYIAQEAYVAASVVNGQELLHGTPTGVYSNFQVTNPGSGYAGSGPQAIIGGPVADTFTITAYSVTCSGTVCTAVLTTSGVIGPVMGSVCPDCIAGQYLSMYGYAGNTYSTVALNGHVIQITSAPSGGTTITGTFVNSLPGAGSGSDAGTATLSYAPFWNGGVKTVAGAAVGISDTLNNNLQGYFSNPNGAGVSVAPGAVNIPVEVYLTTGTATVTTPATMTMTVQGNYGWFNQPQPFSINQATYSVTLNSPQADSNGVAGFWSLCIGPQGSQYLQQQNIAIGTSSTAITSVVNAPIYPTQVGCPRDAQYSIHPQSQFLAYDNKTGQGGSDGISIDDWGTRFARWINLMKVDSLSGLTVNSTATFNQAMTISGGLIIPGLAANCLAVDGSGNVYSTPCGGGGGGGVAAVSNSDGTLTISPTTGAVVASIALGHANTWSGRQTFVAPALGTPISGVITNFTGTCTACNAHTAGSITTNGTAGQLWTMTSGSTQGWANPPSLTAIPQPVEQFLAVGGGSCGTDYGCAMNAAVAASPLLFESSWSLNQNIAQNFCTPVVIDRPVTFYQYGGHLVPCSALSSPEMTIASATITQTLNQLTGNGNIVTISGSYPTGWGANTRFHGVGLPYGEYVMPVWVRSWALVSGTKYTMTTFPNSLVVGQSVLFGTPYKFGGTGTINGLTGTVLPTHLTATTFDVDLGVSLGATSSGSGTQSFTGTTSSSFVMPMAPNLHTECNSTSGSSSLTGCFRLAGFDPTIFNFTGTLIANTQIPASTSINSITYGDQTATAINMSNNALATSAGHITVAPAATDTWTTPLYGCNPTTMITFAHNGNITVLHNAEGEAIGAGLVGMRVSDTRQPCINFVQVYGFDNIKLQNISCIGIAGTCIDFSGMNPNIASGTVREMMGGAGNWVLEDSGNRDVGEAEFESFVSFAGGSTTVDKPNEFDVFGAQMDCASGTLIAEGNYNPNVSNIATGTRLFHWFGWQGESCNHVVEGVYPPPSSGGVPQNYAPQDDMVQLTTSESNFFVSSDANGSGSGGAIFDNAGLGYLKFDGRVGTSGENYGPCVVTKGSGNTWNWVSSGSPDECGGGINAGFGGFIIGTQLDDTWISITDSGACSGICYAKTAMVNSVNSLGTVITLASSVDPGPTGTVTINFIEGGIPFEQPVPSQTSTQQALGAIDFTGTSLLANGNTKTVLGLGNEFIAGYAPTAAGHSYNQYGQRVLNTLGCTKASVGGTVGCNPFTQGYTTVDIGQNQTQIFDAMIGTGAANFNFVTGTQASTILGLNTAINTISYGSSGSFSGTGSCAIATTNGTGTGLVASVNIVSSAVTGFTVTEQGSGYATSSPITQILTWGSCTGGATAGGVTNVTSTNSSCTSFVLQPFEKSRTAQNTITVGLQSVIQSATVTAGSGQTPGVYLVPGIGGNGSGGLLQVTVDAGGSISLPVVILDSGRYTSLPTFTLPSGGTPGVITPVLSTVNGTPVCFEFNFNSPSATGSQ